MVLGLVLASKSKYPILQFYRACGSQGKLGPCSQKKVLLTFIHLYAAIHIIHAIQSFIIYKNVYLIPNVTKILTFDFRYKPHLLDSQLVIRADFCEKDYLCLNPGKFFFQIIKAVCDL